MQLPVIPPHVSTADNTVLSWHERCPKLYEYAALRGLRRKSAETGAGESPPLQFGSILHAGLETWYRTHNANMALATVRDYKNFHEYPEEYRTRGRALVTIAEYIDWWGQNTLWWGDEVIFTETPFILEDSMGFRYGGRIDLIVDYHGKPWVVDHKSTSRGGNDWWNQFKISPQMIGYVWAASLLHGEPVAGVIINRLVVNKTKKPAHEQFERRAFYIYPEQVEEWRRAKIEQYHDIGRQLTNGYFPMRTRNCVEKFGTCEYHAICTTRHEEDREKQLTALYEEAPWDWMANNEGDE